ncbi:MAG: hypothetical protein MHM6MM_002466 [Cercozoa sp. M6MM]
MNENGKRFLGGFFCVGLIVAIFLIAFSFRTIDPLEYGLKYDSVGVNIENKTYTDGRYFIGVDHKFIKFPRTVQILRFCNTGGCDSTAVNLYLQESVIDVEVDVLYKLRKDTIYDLYQNYPTLPAHTTQIETRLQAEFKNSLDSDDFKLACFGTTDVGSGSSNGTALYEVFFQDRDCVHDYLSIAATRVLDNLWSDFVGLTVYARFDSSVENKVIEKLVTAETNKRVTNENAAAIVRRRIDTVDAEANAEIKNVETQYSAQAQTILATARAERTNATIKAKSEQYQWLRANLTGTDSFNNTHVLQWKWHSLLRSHFGENAHTMVGVQTPEVSVSQKNQNN